MMKNEEAIKIIYLLRDTYDSDEYIEALRKAAGALSCIGDMEKTINRLIDECNEKSALIKIYQKALDIAAKDYSEADCCDECKVRNAGLCDDPYPDDSCFHTMPPSLGNPPTGMDRCRDRLIDFWKKEAGLDAK